MIKLEVLDEKENHFILYADEPMRVEVLTTPSGRIVAHVYEGAVVDKEQEPIGMFDGTIVENVSWEVRTEMVPVRRFYLDGKPVETREI